MNFTQAVPILIKYLIIVFIARQIFVLMRFKFMRLIATPLVTLLICGIAIAGFVSGSSIYGWYIIAALGLSLVADSVLMIDKGELFMHGLLFFLCAHIFYCLAFSRGYQYIWTDVPAGILLILSMTGILLKFHKRKKMRDMQFPAAVYMIVISCAVFFALNASFRINDGEHSFQMWGILLFYVSDVILIWSQMVRYVRFATFFVWLFYAPGQLLIALSLLK